MSNKVDRAILFYRIAGIREYFFHLLNQFIPSSRFSRQATLRDFEIHGLGFSQDIWAVLSGLQIEFSADQALAIEGDFENFSLLQRSGLAKEDFPHNWNSGESLRLLVFAFIRLMKPQNVIETGTANGYSTSAIAYAFELNGFGVVHTFDVLKTSAPYVLQSSMPHVNLIQVSENPRNLLDAAQSLNLDTQNGFYLHDADHSYFGQYNDFEIAKKLGIKYYISDDVETSLVFCEKATAKGSSILFDGRKFIGATFTSGN